MTETKINIRVDALKKKKAEKIFDKVGLNMSSAVNLFLSKCINAKGIPFDVTCEPNNKTVQTIVSAQKNEDMFGSFKTVKDCMKALKF